MNRRRLLSLLAALPLLPKEMLLPEALGSSSKIEADAWELLLEQPNQAPLMIESFSLPKTGKRILRKSMDGFEVEAFIRPLKTHWEFAATVRSGKPGRTCFLSLARSYPENCTPSNFNGQVAESAVYRQSPHNPTTGAVGGRLQSVPMIALQTPDGMEVAVSDTPAHFDNFTTQTFDLTARRIALGSGDSGRQWEAKTQSFAPVAPQTDKHKGPVIEPHFFPVDAGDGHAFNVIFLRFPNAALAGFRQQINQGVTQRWSKEPINDLLGATYFGTAYMNLRVNETEHSHFWVVPAIEYCNKQYSRDSFWISMMLPPEYSQSCFENEASYDTEFTGAERQLFTLVWAYRNHLNGFAVDKGRVETILRIVEAHSSNGYYSGFWTNTRKLGCWQGWADVIAFDRDDAISNNQGLFVVALMCAQALGITPKISIEQATQNYRNLFNPQLNAYPLSLQRTGILAVDPLMGDLLAQVFLDKQLLPSEHVLAHYQTMKARAKTPNGFKVVCAPDGSYLPRDQYNSKEFTAFVDKDPDGSYQCGGSWYLYDMQMLMNAHLHGAVDAEDEMIWRTKLEFAKGGTTHEHIDTATGKASKPNMGWNAGTYAMWKRIMQKGKASGRFFDEIDRLRT